jgi:SsrA-binding protein
MRIENRSAHYNYQILETFEAGVDLLGCEVKSLRKKQISLNESFVHLRNGQAWLVNAHIHPYQNSAQVVSPTRSRRLLLHKKELITLANKIATNGLTFVPVSLYNKGNLFKLEVGLAKGKKAWDKRESIKKREQRREIEREVRS